MKTKILLASLILLISNVKAQNIDNPSFDSVYIGGIDKIYQWITSDSWHAYSGDTVLPLNSNEHYDSMGSFQYHEALTTVQIDYSTSFDGPFAIKLFSDLNRIHPDGINFRGFVVNGDHFYTDNNGYIDLKKCGTPFPHRPYSLKGHYKFEDASPSLNNYPQAIVLLKKYNSSTQTSDTIGYAEASMQLYATSSWLPFELPINYLSNQVPDTIVVALLSGSLGMHSTFWVDSLGLDFSFPTNIQNGPSHNDDKGFYQDYSEDKIYFLNDKKIKSVKLYDINGKIVLTKFSSFSSMDISILTNGNYLLSIEYLNNYKRNYKIVK